MIEKIKSSCLFEFKQWKNFRFLSVLLLVLINVLKFTGPLASLVSTFRIRTSPWIFPHFMSSPFNVIIFLLGACALFSNAPFIDNLTYFELGRSNRKAWYFGKVFYIFALSALYVFVNVLFLYLLLFTKTTFIPTWGRLLNTLSLQGFELGFLGISRYIISQYNPGLASSLSVLMAIGQTFFIGVLIFALSLFSKNNKTGLLLALTYSFAPSFLIAFGIEAEFKYVPAMWLSLYTFDRLGLSSKPPIQNAFIIIVISILLLIALGWLGFRTKEIQPYTDIE